MLILMVLAAVPLSAPASHADLRSRVRDATCDLKDITLTCRVKYANHAELKKIGKDFGKSYEIKTTTIRYKSPDKMKMEGKLGMVTASITINGNWKLTRFIVKQKENIKDEPHKRQTDLDLGIFTDSLWRDYIVLDIDSENTPGGKAYKITFVRENAREKKHTCWVDADTLKLMKLEKRESDGSLKSRYIYSDHKKIDGIWIPCTIDVFNEGGKLAGTTVYENIRINSGIPDSEFKL